MMDAFSHCPIEKMILDRKKAQTVHIQQYKMTTPPQVQLQKKEQNDYYAQELCP
jgi:hypothetical protein